MHDGNNESAVGVARQQDEINPALAAITAIGPAIRGKNIMYGVTYASSREFIVRCAGKDGITSNTISAKACVALADELSRKHGIRATTITYDPRVDGATLSLMDEGDIQKAKQVFDSILAANPHVCNDFPPTGVNGRHR